MLTIGSEAPDFRLPDHEGRDFTRADMLAEGRAILFFYPRDFTPGCTKEVCMFRDLHADLSAAGIRVVGVSAQDADSHARFREIHALPYTLLCDPEKRTIRAYGATGALGMTTRRITYLVSPEARILDVVRADIRIGKHEALVRRVLEG